MLKMFEEIKIVVTPKDIQTHIRHTTKVVPVAVDKDCNVCKRIQNMAEHIPSLKKYMDKTKKPAPRTKGGVVKNRTWKS